MLVHHRRVDDLADLLLGQVFDRRVIHQPKSVASAHPGVVEAAPVAQHGGLAKGLGLLPPARVLVGDEVAGVDMAPDLAGVGLGLRRRRGGAEVGALDEGELAKLLRLLVLFAKVRHRPLPWKPSAALSITSPTTPGAVRTRWRFISKIRA